MDDAGYPAFDVSDSSPSAATGCPAFTEPARPETGRVHLLVHRDKGGMLRSSRYELRDPQGALVASAVKCFQKKHASYHMSAGGSAAGKLRSNPAATEYTLHGGGLDAKKCSVWDDDFDEKRSTGEIRQQIASVQWRSKVHAKGMVVNQFAPAVVEGWVREEGSETTHAVRRVEAQWDPALKAFKVDHSDRQHKAAVITSSKNIQLYMPERSESGVVMQFLKVGKDLFSLEYGWPLSGLQAFGIALTVFDEHSA